MFRAKTSLLKFILSLSVLNFGSLILFFFHPDFFRLHPPLERENGSRHESTTVFVSEDPNSWPTLPSYLPWKQTKDVPTGSCEKYFGNGFTKRIDVLHVPVELGDRKSPGWFRCFFSETLRSSICEGSSLRMNPTKIRMSDGGESLESVMGRTEESELPVFEPGAFEIDGGPAILKDRKLVEKTFLDKYMPSGKTMRDLVDSTRLVNSARFKCAEWVEQPTLLVTRFEYANIFHTVTDWYSAYVASRVTDLPYRPHVVFVDGHCRAPLEEAWLAMFSSLRYAKNSTGPLCFRHAILTPLGYETALFKGLSESIPCRGTSAWELKENLQHDRTARLSEFGEMVASSFRLPVDEKKKKTSVRDVVFVRREDYLAHPRHAGEIESRLSNEQQVFDYLKKWVSAYKKCEVNLVNGRFAHMTMRSQVKAIRNASVVIGAHGAGLTHIIAANPSAVVLEIISSHVRRPHFALISQWKGLEYHAISLSGSHADPREVADHLKNILEALAC